jgi:ankyrin repeat protein
MPSGNELLSAFVAIRSGEIDDLHGLLSDHPDLVAWGLGPGGARRPLHVVTDWPGYFPNGPEVARMLIAAGAEVDYRGPDGTGETALHWAASSDDADVAVALIEGGADIEAPAGSIGTPLDNAIGYACWNVARLLVSRGARVDKLWHAAALGLNEILVQLLAADPPPAPADIDQAMWHACAGSQRRSAELLLAQGANLDYTPEYGHGNLRDVAAGHSTQQTNLIEWLEQLGLSASEES